MGTGRHIKRLRLKARASAEKAAQLIGVDANRLRKWESRDLEPRAEDAKKIEVFFGVSLADLPNLESFNFFHKVPDEPDQNQRNYLEHRQEQKLTISTYLVPLVPVKAQAGYIKAYDQTDFIEQLEKFPIAPGINPRGAEWRWFEVEGDSMLPKFHSGDYVLCSSVPALDWRQNLEETYAYVIITGTTVQLKRVRIENGQWIMYSTNIDTKTPIDFSTVHEIWKVRRLLDARLGADDYVEVEKRKTKK